MRPEIDDTPPFAAVAFSGSRFLFWSLAPVLALGALAGLLGIGDRAPREAVLAGVWSFSCCAMILALYDRARFGWAVRVVTGVVFLACLAYLVDEVFVSGAPIRPAPRSQAAPWNSIRAFVAIGVPAFWLTVRGLRPRPPAAPPAAGPATGP